MKDWTGGRSNAKEILSRFLAPRKRYSTVSPYWFYVIFEQRVTGPGFMWVDALCMVLSRLYAVFCLGGRQNDFLFSRARFVSRSVRLAIWFVPHDDLHMFLFHIEA